MRLIKVKTMKHWNPHKDDGLPDNYKAKRYFFETYSCNGCSNIETCKHKTLVIQSTDVNFEMTEKFLDERRKIHYKARFSRSEGINGFLKGDDGVLKLIGTTDIAVSNEIQLRSTIYNLYEIN